MSTIYLDYAAATPLDPAVLKAMEPYFSQDFYNPSATYAPALKVKADITKARQQVAQWLGAKPTEVVFTAGATEANNLAIHGIMQQFPKANVVVSAIEHESVLAPARQYAHKLVKVSADGLIDLTHLQKQIDDHTVLVSIIYANNEVGVIQPLKHIADLLATIRKDRQQKGNKLPLYLHTDAAQAPAYLDLHVSRLGVDLLSINGGKIYGPKQSGALYVNAHVKLAPQILGGGQERGLRSGTENVAQIIGLAAALDLVQARRHEEVARLKELQSLFIAEIQKAIPTIMINGSLKHRLPNNVHITIPGTDNERLIMGLDQKGILCAAGSACSASDEEPSHVLKAMGISDPDAQASLRFSFGHGTSETQLRTAIKTLQNMV